MSPNVNVRFLLPDAGKSTIGGQIMYLTGMVDKRTLEKYEREAREKNRESWYLSWALDTNLEGKLHAIPSFSCQFDSRKVLDDRISWKSGRVQDWLLSVSVLVLFDVQWGTRQEFFPFYFRLELKLIFIIPLILWELPNYTDDLD